VGVFIDEFGAVLVVLLFANGPLVGGVLLVGATLIMTGTVDATDVVTADD
jgi:hypothetical protein